MTNNQKNLLYSMSNALRLATEAICDGGDLRAYQLIRDMIRKLEPIAESCVSEMEERKSG